MYQQAILSVPMTFLALTSPPFFLWLQPILGALGSASVRLSRRNLRVLYDVLDTLSEAMGDAMAAPELVPLYMGPLYQRFQAFEVQVRQCPRLSLWSWAMNE